MLGALRNAVLVMVGSAAVVVVVITNTAGGSASSSGTAVPASYQLRLGDLSGIPAENAHLAQVGARVRIVPLESGCSTPGRPPARPARRRGRGARVHWVRTVMATQAPAGDTTIVLASQNGLDGASFRVHGRGPACVPVIGAVRDW